MNNNLEVGDQVEFNVGKADGPKFYGRVTKKLKDGNVWINPDKASQIGTATFFNIKKVEVKAK